MPKPKEVQYYSHHAKELKRSQQNKIDKFLEHGCIQYDRENKRYECRPLKGYNTRTYILERCKKFGFECSCQGFQSKLKKYNQNPFQNPEPSCSHVGALYEHFARKNRKRK
jgi:hypothetical protein